MPDPWDVRLKNAHDANDIELYYTILAEQFSYGDLALGVVQDNTFSGIFANNFAANQLEGDLGLSFGATKQQEIQLALMQQDYQLRLSKGFQSLSGQEISDYHDFVFLEVYGTSIAQEAWTPYHIVRATGDYEDWRDTGVLDYLDIYFDMWGAYKNGGAAGQHAYEWLQDIRIGRVVNPNDGTFTLGDGVWAQSLAEYLNQASPAQGSAFQSDWAFLTTGELLQKEFSSGALEFAASANAIEGGTSGLFQSTAGGFKFQLNNISSNSSYRDLVIDLFRLQIKYELAGNDLGRALEPDADLSDIFAKIDAYTPDSVAIQTASGQFVATEGGKLLFGTTGNDEFSGGNFDDLLYADTGNDTIEGSSGSDIIFGGEGEDIVDYSASSSAIEVTIGQSSLTLDGERASVVKKHDSDGQDLLFGIEQIKGSDHADKIKAAPGISIVNAGAGDDEVEIFGVNTEVFLGAGNDTVKRAGAGTIIHLGTDQDTVEASANTRVIGADGDDRITIAGRELTGGIRGATRESPWTHLGRDGVSYAVNTVGDLVIRDASNSLMFIANYQDGLGPGDPTANITVFEASAVVGHYMKIEKPKSWVSDNYRLVDLAWKAYFGEPRKPGEDPLVLDLDGDGLELLAQVDTSPVFDLDNDGFGEPTGWVFGDDGLLVRDLNGDGVIDNITELFGDATQDGFTALAALDSNLDGVIDASDDDFGDLLIWQDANMNGVTDAGELQSLSAHDITSIGLANTELTDVVNAGNEVTHQGSFTRGDGSTGDAYNVNFTLDNFNSTYLGDSTISAAAEAQPELKGHGILPSLRIAMTQDANLLSVVQNTLPSLNVIDLEALRAAATPILSAWADVPGTRADVPILQHFDANSELVVDDYAYFDSGLGYWVLASGDDIKDSGGTVIQPATLAEVLASDPGTSHWRTFDGAHIEFIEKYLDEPVPLGQALTGNENPNLFEGVEAYLESTLQHIDAITVRLAMQGPLAPYFADITLDHEADVFRPDTDRGFIPVFEQVLTNLPATQVDAIDYLADWKPILNVVLQDFDRGQSYLKLSYSFLFSQLVAAYEAVQPTVISILDATEPLGIPQDLIVTGGAGVLTGTDDHDIFYMGAGDQTARGGRDHDVYVFGKNFGDDIIDDVEPAGLAHDPDMIRFADYASSEFSAQRSGLDLILTHDATGDTVTVLRQFEGEDPGLLGGDLSEGTGIDEIVFSDGVVWDALEIAYQVADPQATADTIIGTPTIDVLDGGAGDDRLEGGDETDVYVFGLGYGHDTIRDGQTNVLLNGFDFLRFSDGISFSDLQLSRDGDSLDLEIAIAGTSDRVTIERQFASNYTGSFGQQWFDRIEKFTFDDGLNYTWDEILEALLVQARTDGNDTIFGFDYEDILDGGAGDDYLSGGNESDTYLFGLGYGADTVEEDETNFLGGEFDTVLFGAGISLADIVFTRTGESKDLQISIAGDASTLTIVDQFHASYTGVFGVRWWDRIESFEFQDEPGVSIAWDQVIEQVVVNAKTAGNDVIYGFDYEDTLDGGAGDDFLSGGNENDIYVFGYGYGNDEIDENVTNILSGDFDIVSFNADVSEADVLLERGADMDDLVIRLNGSSDTLTVRDTFRSATLASTIDYIEEFHFNDGTIWTLEDVQLALLDIESTSGNDVIRGFRGDDRLDGGAGDDRLEGWSGADTYIFGTGYGQDIIVDAPISDYAGDKVEFTAEISTSDLILSRVNNDLIISIVGSSDTLTINEQFDKGVTGPRRFEIEEFHFNDGTVWVRQDIQDLLLQGTSGNDALIGFETDDTLDGGAGDDRLEGAGGDDTYVFKLGYGHDVIAESQPYVTQGEFDVVEFGSGISPADITVTRINDNLVLTVDGTTDSLTVENYFSGNQYKVEEFHFADATIWNDLDIQTLLGGTLSVIEGTNGNDTLSGTSDPDTLIGYAGDDTLNGGEGSDLYLYASGDGNDAVNESDHTGTDRLVFTDFEVSDVTFSRRLSNTYDLEIMVNATGEVITVGDQFNPFGNGDHGLEEIEFSDGTVWNKAAVVANAWYRGTESADTLSGTSGDDTFVGNGGDDTLSGGEGSDLYLYASGDGNDAVNESDHTGTDRLVFADLNVSDVTFSRHLSNTYDLEIMVNATGEVITVGDQFNPFGNGDHGLEEIEFSDGTVWNKAAVVANAWYRGTESADTLSGTSGDDTFVGNGGDDTLSGGEGSDLYLYASGDGNDFVDEGSAAGTDRFVFTDLNASDVTFATDLSNTSDLTITVNATGEVIRFNDQLYSSGSYNYGVEDIEFADGTVWDEVTFIENAWYRGTSAAETILANGLNNVLIGNGGDDSLKGYGGSDTYIYASGDGSDFLDEQNDTGTDRLVFANLNASDVTFSTYLSNTSDLTITINATGDVIQIDDQLYAGGSYDYGVEEIEFADGTVWNEAAIIENAWYRGTSGIDSINFDNGDDTFYGDLGDDNIRSTSGNDTFIYNSGDGNDRIDEENGSTTYVDTLRLTDLNASDIELSKSGNDLFLLDKLTGQLIEIDEQFWSSSANYGIEIIEFADQSTMDRTAIQTDAEETALLVGSASGDTLAGGVGEDIIYGHAGDDEIDGGGDNDIFVGGAGDDTFVFKAGADDDTIIDFTAGAVTDDVIEFDGLTAFSDFNDVIAATSQNGSDTVIDLGTDGSITLAGIDMTNLHQDDFRFV